MSTVQVKWISKLPLICVCLFPVKTSVQTLITVQSQESVLVSPQCNFTGKIHREELILSQEHSDNESTQFHSYYNFQLFNQPFSGFPGWTNTEQNLWGEVSSVPPKLRPYGAIHICLVLLLLFLLLSVTQVFTAKCPSCCPTKCQSTERKKNYAHIQKVV